MVSIHGLGCGRDSLLDLPLPAGCASGLAPVFSQISAVILLPGRLLPETWNDAASYPVLIQGTGAGRYLRVTGEMPRQAENRGTVGRATNGSLIITHRKYTVNLEPEIGCDEVIDFIRGLQKNWRGFRFYLVTSGGRLIGGPTAIKPAYVNAGLFYPGGRDALEAGYLTMEWFSDVDPAADYVPDLMDVGDGVLDPPEAPDEITCEMYSQYFSAHSGNVLTWTVNGGAVPASLNTRYWVFQNGQRLNAVLGQYSVSPNTAPGQSEITINPLTHFDGADYAVFAFA